MNLKENYIKIRQWFQPYYKPRPDGYVEPELDEVNSEDKQAEEFKSVNGDKALKVKVLTNKNPLTQVVNSKHKPTSGNIIYFYHDDKILQVFARFEQGQGFAHQERDNAARRELDPLIYPTDRQYDRAHLIPIGYHGSENDKRLLIGWDGRQNKKEQHDFEIKVKQLNKKYPIYWLTSVCKVPGGLKWNYRIWNATNPDQPKLVAKEDMVMDCKYVWR